MKQNIYDDKTFNSNYDKMRNEKKGLNANDLIEIPNIRKLIPKTTNKKILDLGCGYGENCIYFKNQGANYVLGIDISKHMINIAKKSNSGANIEYKVISMEDISIIKNKFDIVVSSLAFHYIKNYTKLLKDIYNLLNDRGYLIFSQEHPIFTSSKIKKENRYITISNKKYLLLSDYNRNGLRKVVWNEKEVQKYHRSFSEIINGIVKAGFIIDEILEPIPTKEIIAKVTKYNNQYDTPYFLFIKVHK